MSILKCFVLSLSILILSCISSISQNPRFNGGIVAGFNFAELEGNGLLDYFGINAGFRGTARLGENSQLSLELLYSQNGEYILPDYYPNADYGKVRLDHVEIPVHLEWRFNRLKMKQSKSWKIGAGLAYTRLLNFKAEDVLEHDLSDLFIYSRKDAILLQATTSYFFNKHLGLNLRATMPARFDGLDWTLSARMVYMVG